MTPALRLYVFVEDHATTMASNTLELSGELSTGDTVTVHGQTWVCEPAGWRRVDQPTGHDTDQP